MCVIGKVWAATFCDRGAGWLGWLGWATTALSDRIRARYKKVPHWYVVQGSDTTMVTKVNKAWKKIIIQWSHRSIRIRQT